MKPVILTDNSADNFEDLKKKIVDLFSQDKIYTLETDTDCLVGRPSELQSILICSGNSSVNIEEKSSGKYQKDIKLDG